MTTGRKAVIGVVAALGAFAATKALLSGRWYRVPQNGMYPAMPAGSYLLVQPHPYRTASAVGRGEVVVFVRAENNLRYNYIWRVVALPGDTVEAMGTTVAINGRQLQREKIRDDGKLTVFRERNGPASYEVAYPHSGGATDPPAASMTVPPESFFVMGDNRYNAIDSRYFGAVPFDSIIGKKMWSLP